MEVFYARILAAYKEIATKPYDPLVDPHKFLTEDFNVFQREVEETELQMQKFVKEMLVPIPTSESRLLIMKRFEALKLDCLCLDRRYLDIAQMLEKEIETIKDMLVGFKFFQKYLFHFLLCFLQLQ